MPTLVSDVWNTIEGFPWPLIVLIVLVLVVYRRALPSLIYRAKRVKLPGGFEFEFYEDSRRDEELPETAAAGVASTQTDESLSD